MKKLLLLAGEESGVLYAKRIAAKLDGRVEIRGYDSYGFKTADLGVFGYWEVIKKLFYFLRVKRTMERAIDEWRPDCVCTIDYPGLNLKLAAYAHARGIRAVHVVCPQVWAWHQDRIPKIEASLDKLCCFFPFEPKIFREGLAEFVGHPLVEEFGGASAAVADRGEAVKTLAVLPGSRMGEIGYHLPVILAALRTLENEGVKFKVVIPAANDRAYRAINAQLAKCPLASEVIVTHGEARKALASADAAVVSSGTATLEAALMNCPTVLVYKVSYLLGEFLRRAIKGTKYVGLANVIWDRCGGTGPQPMPELLQENFTEEKVLGCIRPWLADPESNRQARSALASSMALMKSDGDAISRITAAFLL